MTSLNNSNDDTHFTEYLADFKQLPPFKTQSGSAVVNWFHDFKGELCLDETLCLEWSNYNGALILGKLGVVVNTHKSHLIHNGEDTTPMEGLQSLGDLTQAVKYDKRIGDFLITYWGDKGLNPNSWEINTNLLLGPTISAEKEGISYYWDTTADFQALCEEGKKECAVWEFQSAWEYIKFAGEEGKKGNRHEEFGEKDKAWENSNELAKLEAGLIGMGLGADLIAKAIAEKKVSLGISAVKKKRSKKKADGEATYTKGNPREFCPKKKDAFETTGKGKAKELVKECDKEFCDSLIGKVVKGSIVKFGGKGEKACKGYMICSHDLIEGQKAVKGMVIEWSGSVPFAGKWGRVYRELIQGCGGGVEWCGVEDFGFTKDYSGLIPDDFGEGLTSDNFKQCYNFSPKVSDSDTSEEEVVSEEEEVVEEVKEVKKVEVVEEVKEVKKVKKCGKCGEEGHNARTCKAVAGVFVEYQGHKEEEEEEDW